MQPNDKIIFFDGNCPMCHAWVKHIIRWDKKKLFRFAPLESDIARSTLTPLLPGFLEENTIIYVEQKKVYKRSEAILKIIHSLGFPFTILSAGRIIPKKLRDGLYTWVANRRYKYGPRYESCPIPPVEWRDRFLS